MAYLTPDETFSWNGLKIKKYLLTQHNVNKIAMPTSALISPIGVTVHNTPAIKVSSSTTMAEQYTRATVNNAMGSVRVHFYVDEYCAWQNLPLSITGWHAADGNGKGNMKTISIEIIGDSEKVEENAAKLVAYLLDKYKWTVDKNLYTHTHWLNVKDKITGSIDYLNTKPNPYKTCPAYIIPHWNSFKDLVKSYTKDSSADNSSTVVPPQENTNKKDEEVKELYRVRKDWNDASSQIGAYSVLDNAKNNCPIGYSVFDSNGKVVFSNNQQINTPSNNDKEKVDVIYQVYTNKWLPEVTNYNIKTPNGYAGIIGQSIRGIAIKSLKGNLKYRVHIKNGGWLSWISQCNTNDWSKGCAGLKTKNIDAIQMDLEGLDGYKIKYRVCTTNGASYLDWVEGYNNVDSNGYAGIFGRTIERLQISIEKK